MVEEKKPVDILGVAISPVTMSEAVDKVCGFIEDHRLDKKNQPSLIATANAEMIMAALKDLELASILAKASLIVPDGAGTVWAAHYLGYEMPERVAGYDLLQELLKIAPKKNYRFFFFGSKPGVAEAAKKKAEALYLGISIVGCRHGYFKETEENEIVTMINDAKADVLICALGVPRQEKWLSKYQNHLNVAIAMGVGGSLDVMAGTMKRAPIWMQKAKLEWLFRGLCQPSRIGRLMALPRFVFRVREEKKALFNK